MLLAFCLTLVLSAVVVVGLVFAARAITRSLGVDPMALLEWLGLAERPIEPRAQRQRLGQLL